MGKIAIELFEYALMINHKDGLTVIFPEVEHVLLIEQNGRTTAILRGADLELCGPGGAPLPAGKPTEVDYRKFVVDLEAAENATIPVPPALFDPAVPVDRTRINGRLFLKGGTIIGKECSIPANRAPFNFVGGPFLVTDTAIFELAIPDTEVYVLTVNGRAAMRIPDGTSIRIMNSDALGCPKRGFEELDEFVALCTIVGHSGTAPTIGGASIAAMGTDPVCANAQITARESS